GAAEPSEKALLGVGAVAHPGFELYPVIHVDHGAGLGDDGLARVKADFHELQVIAVEGVVHLVARSLLQHEKSPSAAGRAGCAIVATRSLLLLDEPAILEDDSLGGRLADDALDHGTCAIGKDCLWNLHVARFVAAHHR